MFAQGAHLGAVGDFAGLGLGRDERGVNLREHRLKPIDIGFVQGLPARLERPDPGLVSKAVDQRLNPRNPREGMTARRARAGQLPDALCARGLIGMTQSIAADYGAKGIRANVVAPGVIKTDMTKDFWDTDGFQRCNQEMTPFNRDGTIDDVANAVHFLASSEGSFINGQTLALDGGWSTTKYLSMDAIVAERVKKTA